MGNNIRKLTIEKMVPGGFGLARDSENKVVFVRAAFPGEEVMAETVETRRKYDTAVAVEILRPSPIRIPSCRHFPECGGCSLSGLAPNTQRELKQAWVCETLSHALGREVSIDKVLESPLHYRLRNRFSSSPEGYGFKAWRSRNVVPIQSCNLITGKCLEFIRAASTGKGSLHTLEDREETQLISSFSREKSSETITLKVGSYSYRAHPDSFFQANRFLLESYHQILIDTLGETGGERALDLYAGVGFFTLPLSERFNSVTAVERSCQAVEDLQYNTQNFSNVKVVSKSVQKHLRETDETYDLILADPPREGLGADLTAKISELAPANLILFSCDAATLARDLVPLLADGGYLLQNLTLFDQFPETHHVELAVHLRRSSR